MRKYKCDMCGKLYVPKEIIAPKMITENSLIKLKIKIWSSLNCDKCNKQTKMLHKLMKTSSKEDVKKKKDFIDKIVKIEKMGL